MMLHVVAVAYKRPIELRVLIDCFLRQTDSRWDLNIIHDGPPPESVQKVISLYNDPRIKFTSTERVNGHWGHPNRNIALSQLLLNHKDFVLITNDDNMYVPNFVEYFLKECKKPHAGFVYCDTLHSYLDYDVMKTELKEHHIDMGSFIVKLDVAKRVGFKHRHFSADGAYAVECINYCRRRRFYIYYLPKCLFIHC